WHCFSDCPGRCAQASLLSFPTRRSSDLTPFPRYLKAAHVRIDKLRADPARDARLMAEMAPLIAQYQRAVKALKGAEDTQLEDFRDRKSTRLNSSHVKISYAAFCLKKKRA